MKYQYLLIILFFCACATTKETPLRIAFSANMQFAGEELIQAFEEETGISCQSIVSSSGILTAQILEGAPFHIFLSADMKYPQKIYEEGLSQHPPKVYARGKLVLWTMSDIDDFSLDILSNESLQKVAIANPKTAPYGMASEAQLNHMGLGDKLRSKLVFGESINQTNQFIQTGAAEVGFTSKSTIKAKPSGRWIEVKDFDPEILNQGIVMLKNDSNLFASAEKFYTFLFSKKAKDILIEYGYEIP